MKAIARDRYGSPETLTIREVEKPPLTDEGVLVSVHASSVNAYDWHVLRGKPYFARFSEGLRRPSSPILGLDVAGVAEAVGPSVIHVKPGDRVFGSRLGAFAEYVTGKNMVAMPANATFEQAAAVPTAGQTALQGLRDHGRLQPGERVLVNGAGGGVGTFAVQLAKALGGHVTAVTSSANLDLMRSIGADEVVDYRRDDFTRGRDRYDLILDLGATRSLGRMRRTLTPAGRIVSVAPGAGNVVGPLARIAWAVITNRLGGKPARGFMAGVNRDDLAYLARLIEAGSLTPVIDRTYRFDEIPTAIAQMESGRVTGKIVITI